MKKITLFIVIAVVVIFGVPVFAHEEALAAEETVEQHTLREEREGREVWENLQAKTLQCADLTEENYAVLGEYFMGQMTGSAHVAMNTMMTQMMGEEGEEQMHVVLGKRLSGCIASAALPAGGFGFMSMMQMVGGWPMRGGFTASTGSFLMNGLWGIMALIWLILLSLLVLVVLGIIALVKFLNRRR